MNDAADPPVPVTTPPPVKRPAARAWTPSLMRLSMVARVGLSLGVIAIIWVLIGWAIAAPGLPAAVMS